MKTGFSAIVSAVALGWCLTPSIAAAQETKGEGDAPVDYSEDPSYKAARDFFRTIGADQPRQLRPADI